MSPSEVAFLALGLVLGIATGAAIIVILGTRPPTHEIRLTVTRDAIPRRASTLAADAFHRALDGPAPGGPGDRRSIDRDEPGIRTIVHPVVAMPLPFAPHPRSIGPAASADLAPIARSGLTAVAIEPEPDPLLAELSTSGSAPSLHLVLAGDHRAMLRLVDLVSGMDADQRRAWEELLTAFVEAVRARAIDLGLIDLPMGNPFWDTFTIDQCREIVVALASAGRRYDGHDAWADGFAPTYRDLSRALAEVGVDPRRVRGWPNSAEIAELFRGARVAADEAVARWAPTLEAPDLRTFLADRGRGLDSLWAVWDAVRVAIGADAADAIALDR
ncbi:MAG TPA: hypothetical protein VJ506_01935 [Candidatus Limnocylindrales bacterium]|nr:hypothetical protein [Candidatus Limnocylindrales bacterium]